MDKDNFFILRLKQILCLHFRFQYNCNVIKQKCCGNYFFTTTLVFFFYNPSFADISSIRFIGFIASFAIASSTTTSGHSYFNVL